MKVSEAFEAYLKAINLREESNLKERKYYVSDMGKCQRTRWLKRKGVSTELTPYVYWIFAMGDMIHDFGYKALEAQGILLKTEETVENEHWVGRFDGIVKLDKPCIFDFKSTGQWAMKKVIAGGEGDDNIGQVLTYVMMYRKDHKEISDTGLLVYLNKEPNDRIPVVAYDREYHLTSMRVKALEEEMGFMEECWLKDKMPPCTCPEWMRNYNSFLPFCLMKEKDIRKYLTMLAKGTKIISTKQGIFTEKDGKRKEAFHL